MPNTGETESFRTKGIDKNNYIYIFLSNEVY